MEQKTQEKITDDFLYDDLDEQTLLEIDNDIASQDNDEEEQNKNQEDYKSVVADDSYSAEITAEEMGNAVEAYLIQEEGESRLRLIVFGDKDSKRSVSNVAQIIVE